LKWITSKGEVLQYPCVIEGTLSSANAQVAKTITQANSHIDIVVQGNKDTLDIYKNLRIVINGCVYRFYSINNYMQNDYVDKDTPLLFMDFFLDMKIDEDNLEENLANDNRADFILECNVNQVTNKKERVFNMPNRKKFDKVENYVIEVLENNRRTRDDDMLLYYYVCKLMTAKTSKEWVEPTFIEMAAYYKDLGFPSYETVSRVRRKIVNGSRPDLQSAERKKIRQEQIPDYVNYALDK
jgi:hypothetical protein